MLLGRYPLGSRLDQNALAQELGVSTIPVREALRRLEAEGLVSISPRRGAFVATLSPNELREIYQIREVLDELAIKNAVPRLSDDALHRLGRVVEALDEATQAGDVDALLRLNRQFHGTIYAAAAMPRLLALISNLADRYAVYNRVYVPRHAEQSRREHLEIYAACRSRDVRLAARLTRQHIRRACRQLLKDLEAMV